MKFLQINACSRNIAKYLINDYVNKRGINFVCVSETWDIKDLKVLRESGFIPVTKPRLTDFHGGVSVLYRACEKVVPREDLDIPHLEITWVEALLSGTKTLIASIYIPPNKDKDLLSLDRLLHKIGPQPNLMLLSDFNCRDLVWEKWHSTTAHPFRGKAWSMGKKLLDICNTHGLTISINGTYTREEDGVRSSPDISLI